MTGRAPQATAQGHASRTPRGGTRNDALFVNSLQKGLRVLHAFGASRQSLGLTEIARETGLNVSAAQRYVHTLHRLGYLSRDEHARRYCLTPKLLDFSFAYLRADALAELAVPHLIELGEQCDETVNLSQLDGVDIVCITRMPRRDVRSTGGFIGARRPAFCTSSGRAMLAHLRPEEAVRILDESDRTSLAPNTITEPDAILERVAEARSMGYSIVEEEFVTGEISVAAAILDYSGRPAAAINVPVPTTRWTVEAVHERLAPMVIHTARAISRAKGAASGYDES